MKSSEIFDADYDIENDMDIYQDDLDYEKSLDDAKEYYLCYSCGEKSNPGLVNAFQIDYDEEDEFLDSLPKCPYCDSTNIEYEIEW